MANSAPVEVWERILKYSIAVSLFFSSDPVVEHGLECLPRYCFEAEYWDSERTRNNCRRVCRSWNAFLRRYDHRYVRLSDIYYRRIPLEVMSMAIRLNVSPERGSERDMRILTAFNRTSALFRSYFAPTGEARGLVKEWRLEILEGSSHINLGRFMSCLENSPRLRAVLSQAPGKAQPKAAGLRFLYMDSIRANASSESLVLQHLTTLHLISFPLEDFSFKDVSFKDWRLPSLQHLSIEEPIDDQDEFGNKMLEIVQAIRRNLVTLHFQGIIPDFPAPNIWPHIPHVERIQMPYWKGTSIPADHPARIVTIPVARLVHFIKNGESRPAMNLFNHLPHPKQFSSHCLIVKMDVTWLAALMQTVLIYYQPQSPLASAIWLAGYYEHLGVEFADVEGVNLQDYLVFATKFYWKGRRASVHKRKGYTAATLAF